MKFILQLNDFLQLENLWKKFLFSSLVEEIFVFTLFIFSKNWRGGDSKGEGLKRTQNYLSVELKEESSI